MGKISSLFAFALIATACSISPGRGVSCELAGQRKSDISDVRYRIEMDIPLQMDSCIKASESVSLNLRKRGDIVLDFKADGLGPDSVLVNGRRILAHKSDGHIIIPRRYSVKGQNSIGMVFTAGDLSLNRREEFLYTLLVPDRASTLFPCFDQPDIKAVYELTLEIPSEWTAVSNTGIRSDTLSGEGRRKVSFKPTEPLSTYLFSFVCGKFSKVSSSRGGRSISVYHRETDPDKIAQCPGILESIFDALEYMEEYTSVPYPFDKYECVAIPDFQYGGMEHTGATLYNDRSLFLDAGATTSELQNRESLIAHETAHMWFGDYVTMKWFNDVWTKEVFANWFAARMTRPKFPGINYAVSDLYNHCASAYSEDRTPGSNAIQRPLDNLNDAGLIYCNIIYDKAPVVLEMLNRKIGEDAMKAGIREYVRNYGYGNAGWDELAGILAGKTDFDVNEWSRVWIKEKGMPEYDTRGNCFDYFGNGNVWPQDIGYMQTPEGLSIPNPDGTAYGCFRLDRELCSYIYAHFHEFDETLRMSASVNLFENVWRNYIDPAGYQEWLCKALRTETNPLIFENMLDNGYLTAVTDSACRRMLEDALADIIGDGKLGAEQRLLSFRTFSRIAVSDENCARMYEAWDKGRIGESLPLGENDRTALSYQLMLRYPERAMEIRDTQAGRIDNPDRKDAFAYICKAVSPVKEVRDSLFNSFACVSGREPESRVLTALSLLCSPVRGLEAVSRIRPALELLPEVQRTGDIFFPATWCKRLLSSQSSPQAYHEVRDYLDCHRDLNPLLRTKVEQAAGWMLRKYGNEYDIIPAPAELIPGAGSVTINGKDIVYVTDSCLADEEYIIEIDKAGARVRAGGNSGLIYAEQTIRQLVPGTGISGKLHGKVTLPVCRISDRPRYGCRSLMLDCCRHFVRIDEIKRVLDIMCFYKLNRFHWHLTDDQGWRVEISKYPELTRGQEHYDRKDLEEIVEYAADRGIEVVPEFEIPGHSMAALSAIPELGCTGGPYEMPGTWGVFDDVMCPGKESTFDFIEDVLDEMTEIFPCRYIHIGGDECPTVRWEECRNCRKRIEELGLTDSGNLRKERKLQNYVTSRVQEYLAGKGRKIIGWEEILDGDLDSNAVVMSWSGTDAGIKAAAQGIPVIMAPACFCYLDHCQVNPDKSDPADASLEPESNEYFLPLEWCHEYEPETGFTDRSKDCINGIEACLWSEYVEDSKKLEYMLLPRLAAVSEVQWRAKGARDYDGFLKSLTDNHFPRYDAENYMYCKVCLGINGYWK